MMFFSSCFFFFQAEDGIRDLTVTGVQTCALPISRLTRFAGRRPGALGMRPERHGHDGAWMRHVRSEEHTSELQSQSNLVCRLLLEKKKKHTTTPRLCSLNTTMTRPPQRSRADDPI